MTTITTASIESVATGTIRQKDFETIVQMWMPIIKHQENQDQIVQDKESLAAAMESAKENSNLGHYLSQSAISFVQ